MGWLGRWWGQFKGFALKGNVLEPAEAVVLGRHPRGLFWGRVPEGGRHA